MNETFRDTLRRAWISLPNELKVAFDATATWVTQLSWWKFLLFAILILIAGGITNETLFSSSRERVVEKHVRHGSHSTHGLKSSPDSETEVEINASGIHIHKNRTDATTPPVSPDASTVDQPDTASPPSEKESATNPDGHAAKADQAKPATRAESAVTVGKDDVHIKLPPGVGRDVQDAIDEAVDDAAAQKVETYRERGSDWFMNFVLLLVLCLFGTKALMGGKKRAEARAATANAMAERESMQRQVTEAKMQMMQAQVEPHFLFNTLASVEYLIETDPPRAARMQRSLIQYLRAVIPQMRETAPITNLGREADMVSAYLDLLKMRMEERLVVECQIPAGLRSAAFPPMMLQSLVENAIKHGLECKPEGGTLRISAEVIDQRLQVTVSDTGMGFGAVASNGTGLGLQNIRERLKLLHGAKGQLIIAPNRPSGVIATIDVPYQMAN